MTERPVLVTVLPARTAKGFAVPRPTGGWAPSAASESTAPPSNTTPAATAITTSRRCGSDLRTGPAKAMADLLVLTDIWLSPPDERPARGAIDLFDSHPPDVGLGALGRGAGECTSAPTE